MPTPPIWLPKPPSGGGTPDHPIYYPPVIWPEPPVKPDEPPIEAKLVWIPTSGWGVVFVPTDAATVPTPSK